MSDHDVAAAPSLTWRLDRLIPRRRRKSGASRSARLVATPGPPLGIRSEVGTKAPGAPGGASDGRDTATQAATVGPVTAQSPLKAMRDALGSSLFEMIDGPDGPAERNR